MTYEYVCEACGHQWEAEQSIKDSPLKTCGSCGESRAKRLVSGGTGFLLKGGGWYADLYSSSGAGAAKAPDDKAAPKSTKTEGADTKPGADGKTAGKTSGESKAASAQPASSSSTSGSSGSGPSSASAKAS